MRENSFFKFTLPSIALAAGIAVAGYFIGNSHYKSKLAVNTAQAKGLAERRVKADTAIWSVSLSVTGKSREEVPQLYKEAEAQQQRVVDLLKATGLTDNEISIGLISHSSKEYRDDNKVLVDEKQFLSSSVTVETQKVELISQVRSDINKLIVEGIELTNYEPSYLFTRLNQIKPDMLKEAAKNARVAANEFAENAGLGVGKIRSATQGGFQVVDVGASYGDTNKIEKNVRVVTKVEFYLEDE